MRKSIWFTVTLFFFVYIQLSVTFSNLLPIIYVIKFSWIFNYLHKHFICKGRGGKLMPKTSTLQKKKHLLFRGGGLPSKLKISSFLPEIGAFCGENRIIKTQNINSSRGSSVEKLFPKNIHKNNILIFQHQGITFPHCQNLLQ